MTPAINTVKKCKIEYKIHEYTHDPNCSSYGEEAAEKLGVEKERLFKTLVVSDENAKLYVAVLPVSTQLNLKLFAKAIGCKKIEMADKSRVEKVTGYVLGGVSPIGQKKQLKTVIDETANKHNTIFISAGRRGLDIELAPADLQEITRAKFETIGR